MLDDTPRSYTSPRDDRFYTPRTIARSNSQSNSDEWVSPREFQTPRSHQNSDRTDRSLHHPHSNINNNNGGNGHSSYSDAKEFYNPNDYYHQSKSSSSYYNSDVKGSQYNNNNGNNSHPQHQNPPHHHHAAQPKSSSSSSSYPNSAATTAPSSSSSYKRPQYIAEEGDEDPYSIPHADSGDSHGRGGGGAGEHSDVMQQTYGNYNLEEIFSLARHGRCGEIDDLLDSGLPVDVRDEFGNTLLIIACQNGNKRVAKTVLRKGANINARNFKGNTPLHYCYQYGYGESLGQYLISKGGDPDLRNNTGKFTWQGI